VHRRRRVPRRLALRQQGQADDDAGGAVLKQAASNDDVALVCALDRRRAIGRDGGLPWHLPDDLKRFKALTLGHPMLMGRRTAESLGRALPKRRNLVLTRGSGVPFAGMERVASLDEALELAGGETLIVIGGGEVFALALPRATRMHLTFVDTIVEGADAWFPDFDASEWRELSRSHHAADAQHAFAFDDIDYEKRGQTPYSARQTE
jgi:dihydrofolate reductase